MSDPATPYGGVGPVNPSVPAVSDTGIALKPPTTSATITPSDSTDLTSIATKGIFIGTGGNVAIKLTGDSVAVTMNNVPDGTFIPGAFLRVMATNTTASNIIGFGG